MMTSINRLPTTTAYPARLRIFQPTRRPAHISNDVNESQWGKVSVTGKLGQQHADLLEAICFHAQNATINEDGQLKILVDPARVSKSTRLEGIGLKNATNQLMTAVIEIMKPEGLRCIGHLVDTIHPAMRKDGTAITVHNPLGGTRALWTVIIGNVGMVLLNHDLKLFYNPEPISKMRHGAAQAIARIVLTHDPNRQPNGGFRIDTLIKHTCGTLTPSAMRDHRRYIRSEASQLAKLDILIDGDRVKRRGKSDGKRSNVGHLPNGVGHLPDK